MIIIQRFRKLFIISNDFKKRIKYLPYKLIYIILKSNKLKHRMKIELLFGLLISALMLSSCSDDGKGEESKKFTIKIENDISKFNVQTGEITFKAGEIFEANLSSKERFMSSVGLNSIINFNLGNASIFESIPIHPEYSSYVENDLVFVMMEDMKYYLLNGYPSLEVLGENKTASEKIRNENLEKRKANWDKFINYLKDAELIIE